MVGVRIENEVFFSFVERVGGKMTVKTAAVFVVREDFRVVEG